MGLDPTAATGDPAGTGAPTGPPPNARRFAVLDPATGLFAAPAHRFTTHDQLTFTSDPGAAFPTGVSTSRVYFIRDVTPDTFRISTMQGGPPVDPGTAGAGYVRAVPPVAKPTPTWMYVLIGVGAAIVLALILAFLPRDVAVPAVAGLSQADATTVVEQEKLTLEVAGAQYSTAYPEGSVIAQYPEAGTQVPKGSKVDVLLSTKNKQVKVPDVTGQALAPGLTELRNAGLTLAPVKVLKSDEPRGTILEQSPKGGTEVQIGSAVTLTLSEGPAPEPVPMPNLLGMEESVAVSIVEALGLKSVTQDVDSARPQGEVVEQDPEPGEIMDPGSTATLSVSRGNKTTTTTAPVATTTTETPTPTTEPPATTEPPTTEPATTEPPTTEGPRPTEPATTDTTEPLAPSNILYEADWSTGMDGWSGTGGWTVSGGVLVNDGEASAESGTPAAILAPFEPDTPDYTIVAVIALTGTTKPVPGPVRAFGQVARYTSAGAYTFGCGPEPASGLDNLFVANVAQGESIVDHVLGMAPFDPGTGFHTYRFEVSGNTISVSVDSRKDIEVSDDRFTAPGQVGLWAAGTPISVKSFKVYRVQ